MYYVILVESILLLPAVSLGKVEDEGAAGGKQDLSEAEQQGKLH